jgi:hypothetical protein
LPSEEDEEEDDEEELLPLCFFLSFDLPIFINTRINFRIDFMLFVIVEEFKFM